MSQPTLKKGIRFEMGPGTKKYKAILPDGKSVYFGHKNYEHYKDTVPKRLGGGLWSHRDHLDPDRRKNYRRRHGALRCKDGKKCIQKRYSPAWFSYYFLW